MKRTLLLLLFGFLVSLAHYDAWGQSNCDSLSSDLTKQFDKYSQKKFNKLINDKNIELTAIYNLGTYFRIKGDTAYKQWYGLFVDRLKYYWKSDKHRGQRGCILFMTGKVYYYQSNYSEAITYFTKAIAAKCDDPCINYFLTDANKKLNNN